MIHDDPYKEIPLTL